MKKLFRTILVLFPMTMLLIVVTQGNALSTEQKEDNAGYNEQFKNKAIQYASNSNINHQTDYELERKQLHELKKQQMIEILKKKEEVTQEKPTPKEAKKVVISRGSSYTSTYEITHYTAYCNGCSGKTSSGYDVSQTIYYGDYRIVAAPKTIAFNTKLKITYADGTEIQAIVLDRGGDIGVNRLDLLVADKKEAYRLGRQKVQVEIIK